ncbi:hypothetical protein [Pseudonocardia sp. TRM90224]|uniref:hypothetical protein n=1 Tax=Pseudonocardia sp. TRM90224 TaxID=2812678 RepID=UPI001E40EB90|nr:hypothetical protein [Pseudonocardia sp. TRM90224]
MIEPERGLSSPWPVRLQVITTLAITLLVGSGCASRDDVPPPVVAGPPTTTISYPHTLFTHCGIRTMTFDGREWIAITHIEQPYPNQLIDHIAGTVTLVRADLARFKWEGGISDFVPAQPGQTSGCM